MNCSIPELKIEITLDESGEGFILLEQDHCGESMGVSIHPSQIRLLAEKLGIVAVGDAQEQRNVATLTQRLDKLRKRIDHMAEQLAHQPCNGYPNLPHAQMYAAATAEIAAAYCAEFIQQPLDESNAQSMSQGDQSKVADGTQLELI